MLFKHFYDDNLAQASYLVGCEETREAIVVDPTLDVAQYVRAAGAERLRISHVTETHIHADFVSGASALAEATGAKLHLSAAGQSEWGYSADALRNARALADGDDISFGAVRLRATHTPGHTPEHLSFLISDLARGQDPVGAFTGDFIFVGDVGRPDLLERAVGAPGSMDRSARDLYASIQKFLNEPDHLLIWPGHGAGSACGRALGSMPQSTLGYERLFNWALAQMDEDEFVQRVLADQPFPPAYFARMKRINRNASADGSPAAEVPEATVEDLSHALKSEAAVIDTRPAARFASSHIPGTINIPYNKSFLNWCGALVRDDQDVYLITDAENAEAVQAIVNNLRKIGVETFRGYLPARNLRQGQGEKRQLEEIPQLDAPALRKLRADGGVTVIDVRGPDEWRHGHLPGATHIPLAALPGKIEQLDRSGPIVLHCKGGGRSAIATSFLKAHGFANVANLTGGFEGWAKEGFEVVTELTAPQSSADAS
jgi:hydroxyacylglutathione hydrolase